MSDSRRKSDIASWSNMWRNPTVTSFSGMFPDSYDGSILEFWKTQLVSPFNQIVDLACGRGRNALALARAGIDCLGLDRNGDFLRELRDAAGPAPGNVATLRCDLESGHA